MRRSIRRGERLAGLGHKKSSLHRLNTSVDRWKLRVPLELLMGLVSANNWAAAAAGS